MRCSRGTMLIWKRLGSALCAAGTGFAILLGSSSAFAQAADAGHKPEPWPYVFPLLGERAAKKGIRPQLPFGLGLNYAYANQPINITRVAVGVNDGEMVDLTHLITFDKLRSQVQAMNLRADLWVLPFLNVYLMGNYIFEAKTQVSISEPFAFDAGATQSGVGGGFGTTLAGGVWGFFATIDLNWTWNKMQKLEDPVGTFLLTPRVGRNFGKFAGMEWILWVGAMEQTIESKTRGSIRLKEAIGGAGDGSFQDDLENWYNGLPPVRQAIVRGLVGRLEGSDPVIHYDLDKAIAYPWNMLVGGELGITPSWRFRAEVGFINRTQVVLGLNYRFGGFRKAPEKDGDE